MENKESSEILKKIHDALFKAQIALDHQEEGWIRHKHLEKQFVESEKENKQSTRAQTQKR